MAFHATPARRGQKVSLLELMAILCFSFNGFIYDALRTAADDDDASSLSAFRLTDMRVIPRNGQDRLMLSEQ